MRLRFGQQFLSAQRAAQVVERQRGDRQQLVEQMSLFATEIIEGGDFQHRHQLILQHQRQQQQAARRRLTEPGTDAQIIGRQIAQQQRFAAARALADQTIVELDRLAASHLLRQTIAAEALQALATIVETVERQRGSANLRPQRIGQGMSESTGIACFLQPGRNLAERGLDPILAVRGHRHGLEHVERASDVADLVGTPLEGHDDAVIVAGKARHQHGQCRDRRGDHPPHAADRVAGDQHSQTQQQHGQPARHLDAFMQGGAALAEQQAFRGLGLGDEGAQRIAVTLALDGQRNRSLGAATAFDQHAGRLGNFAAPAAHHLVDAIELRLLRRVVDDQTAQGRQRVAVGLGAIVVRSQIGRIASQLITPDAGLLVQGLHFQIAQRRNHFIGVLGPAALVLLALLDQEEGHRVGNQQQRDQTEADAELGRDRPVSQYQQASAGRRLTGSGTAVFSHGPWRPLRRPRLHAPGCSRPSG